MEKQISFQGVSLNPYGDISPDGELSACVNLQNHGGALRPTVLNGTEYNVSGELIKLVAIHATSSYRHMIFYDGTSLYWANEEAGDVNYTQICSVSDFRSVYSIGNTLIITSGHGLLYALFKNGKYSYLGQLPEITLSFALEGYGDSTVLETVKIETIPGADINNDFSENNKQIITNAVMASVNNFINEKHEQGFFVFPFFVRYAVRLYDGELIRHSVPVLMSCTVRKSVIVSYYPPLETGDTKEIPYKALLCYFELYYKSAAYMSGSDLDDWSDIIASVDIFISEPIYTFYPDKLCERFFIHDNQDMYAVCSLSNDHLNNFQKRLFMDIVKSNMPSYSYSIRQVELPYKDDEEIIKAIKDTSNFYLLKSIPLNELTTSFTKIDLNDSIINNLTLNERMTDDYDSHDIIIANSAFVYNKRLILFDIQKQVYQGQTLESSVVYQNNKDAFYTYTCYIYANVNGNNVVFKIPGYIRCYDAQIDYFFFPYIDAYKAVFVKTDGKVYEVNLEKHPLLNGVFFCSGFYNSYQPGTTPSVTGSNIISLPNYIYTSQVNNPFYFPVEGINTVGTGEIIGLSAITTALSQGQFGSFPLMAFCTDGNYALQINSEGLFINVSPMQRDVCINPASITQIDGAILFVSAKGVMLANGSDIQCISTALDGVYEDLINVDINVGFSDRTPPVDYFQSCMIAYDYSGKRLLFMKPESNVLEHGWQFDIDTKKWFEIDFAGVRQVINVYPYSYIQQQEFGSVKNIIKKLDLTFDYYNADNAALVALVTRPLKLDSFQLKSISQVSIEGNFKRPQRMSLIGSNNLKDWFLIGTTTNKRMLLRGRFFKFFRIAIVTELANNENISGCRIIYTVKPEYRLR